MTKIMKLLIIPFLLTFPFTVFAQPPSDNKNDEKVYLKVLEERVKQVEEKTNIRLKALEKESSIQDNSLKGEIEALGKKEYVENNLLKEKISALEKLMDRYVWFFVVFIVFIGSALTFFGRRAIFAWIKESIQSRTNEEIEKYVGLLKEKGEDAIKTLLSEFEERLKEKLSELDKLREDYENSINTLGDKIKDHDIKEPLSEEADKDLADFEGKLSQFKKEEKYSFEDWFYKGIAEYKKADYKKAVTSWSKALDIKPGPVAHNNRGLTYAELGQYERAIEDYNKAIELDPESALAYNNRGNAYDKLEQYERAIEDYNKAIELDPKYASPYNNRGLTYAELGQYERAIEDYNKAIELDPESALAYNNRGNAYDKLEQCERAIEDYNKAIELDPESALAYNNRGNAYDKLEQCERAIEDYNKAIELDPEYLSAYENICEATIFIGDYGGAFEYVTKALSLSSDIEDKAICLYLKCVIDKLLNKDITESENEFNEILENKFTLRWSFDGIENWLNKADISNDTKEFIANKTEFLKKRRS